MPQLVITKQYADGTVLTAAQLDAAYASITTLLNITGLGADNLQDNSIGQAEIQTSGVGNTNLAPNSVSTSKVVDAAITYSKELPPTETDLGNVITTAAVDFSASPNFKMTFVGNTAITVSNGKPGFTGVLKIVQGGSGSYTATFPGNFRWPFGVAPTLSTTVGATDLICFYFDGTDYFCNASLGY